ncbi:MAG TPA: 1-acyl-sn-glycerol-3-phosphate acyltransferase, partial [Gammaproteobacteria bacterium]|nr:1-acyl-sn-glycerol-3-phosphate acyltransferase [Gammaproteobacteria bacterium]
DFRFILKDSLKWFPGFGWYSYLMGYPFTRRARISELKADKRLRGVEKAAIIEAINRDKNNPLAWCCFPEGTRLNKGRSNGSFRHVQEPKIGSFLQYIQALDYNVKVIDVTIAYRIQPCSILRLLYEPKHMGDIWLDVVDINANMDRKGLRELLLNLWNKKDARLSRYEKKERVDVG